MKALTAFKNFSTSTQQGWFSTSLVLLRVVIGVQFLMAGIVKVNDWSAAGNLETATGPLASWFQGMEGSIVVDQLNIWGLTFIGVALILGLLVRPASFFGAVLMILYYLAHFEQNIESGFIEYHIIYALIFILFLAGGIGHVFGLDGIISRHFRRKKFIVKMLFG
ncbi:DoxX family protein [Patescibacteria group bacterium]|nr:DoxX family protein [Patescibacteria group bacterium]